LTVTNEGGFSAAATQSVTVATVPEPKADFVVSPAAPVAGDSVHFNASASRAATGHSITGYTWDFGDGSGPATGETPSHVFKAEAIYTVTLSVTDDTGQRGTASRAVSIGAAPAPAAEQALPRR
jgi:PKD repeat protein